MIMRSIIQSVRILGRCGARVDAWLPETYLVQSGTLDCMLGREGEDNLQKRKEELVSELTNQDYLLGEFSVCLVDKMKTKWRNRIAALHLSDEKLLESVRVCVQRRLESLRRIVKTCILDCNLFREQWYISKYRTSLASDYTPVHLAMIIIPTTEVRPNGATALAMERMIWEVLKESAKGEHQPQQSTGFTNSGPRTRGHNRDKRRQAKQWTG